MRNTPKNALLNVATHLSTRKVREYVFAKALPFEHIKMCSTINIAYFQRKINAFAIVISIYGTVADALYLSLNVL